MAEALVGLLLAIAGFICVVLLSVWLYEVFVVNTEE